MKGFKEDWWVYVLVVLICLLLSSLAMLIAEGIQESRARDQALADCKTDGYIAMVKVGDAHVCVGRTPDGEYIAKSVELVRSRADEE